MPTERNAFRLGLMAIVVFVLLFGSLMFIGGTSFEQREEIVVWIAHDQKLPRVKVGAPIICGPQQVGSVIGVSMIEAPAEDNPAVTDFLYFEFRGRVNTSLGLRADCRIVVEGPLLGENGQLTIENRGTSSSPATPDTPIYARAAGFASELAMITAEFDQQDPHSLLSQIKSQMDPAMPRSMVAKLHRSLDDLNAMSGHLSQAVDPTRREGLLAKIDSVLNHLNAVTAALRDEFEAGNEEALLAKAHGGLDLLDQGLAAIVEMVAENRPGITSTVEHIEHAAVVLDQEIVGPVADELDRDRAESLLTKLHESFDQLGESLADVGVAAEKARSVAVLSHDRLVTLIDNAKEASAHIKALTKDLRRAPWRLIHKPTDAETKEAAILGATREFAEASAYLDDSIKQLESLADVKGGQVLQDDPTLMAARERLEAALSKFGGAEEALWELLDVR